MPSVFKHVSEVTSKTSKETHTTQVAEGAAFRVEKVCENPQH